MALPILAIAAGGDSPGYATGTGIADDGKPSSLGLATLTVTDLRA
jgi:hypothetical protein